MEEEINGQRKEQSKNNHDVRSVLGTAQQRMSDMYRWLFCRVIAGVEQCRVDYSRCIRLLVRFTCQCASILLIITLQQTIRTLVQTSLRSSDSIFRAHPKEQTTVMLGSRQVALAMYATLPILQIILGLHGGKKLSTKTRYRHSTCSSASHLVGRQTIHLYICVHEHISSTVPSTPQWS